MAEFIEEKEQAVNKGDPIIFENKTGSAFDVSVGIVFHESGIYEVSIAENRTVVFKIMERSPAQLYADMSDEEFEKWLYEHGICNPNIHESIPCDVVPLLIDNAISELPPAQSEIIRCKDCKWFNDIGCAIRIVDDTDKPSEEDYCSFAERRQDEC